MCASSETPQSLIVDDMLDAFQRACEDVTVAYERGSPDRIKYEKERAVLRNDLRSRLLAAHCAPSLNAAPVPSGCDSVESAGGQKP